ncbi:MAG TPA: ABC transporter substrate-binding protein [Anaerolineales bacterium]
MSGSHGARRRATRFLTVLIFILSACTLPFGRKPQPTPVAPSPVPAAETATPTPAVPRALTVCLGAEPNTLYPFDNPNDAARSVLAALDNGPIDAVSYEYQPVALTKLPSLADGDAQVVPVTVKAGSKIVDAFGQLTALSAGSQLRPSGCRADNCLITYNGASQLTMDQMVVTFHMRPDLTWSDGTPLSAEDSVYAYQLAADPDTPGSKDLVNHTQTYEAVDTYTTRWSGIPGYLDPAFMTNFWSPEPKHLWSQYKALQLLTTDIAARSPVGWGPYKMEEWVARDHITLVKNPYYFRASAGYPKFDQLVFRFISDPNAAISELAAGHCNILDPSVRLDSQVALLQQMQKEGKIRAFIVPGMAIEWLGLGVVPAAYDQGANVPRGTRPDLLADPRTRQAIALCSDRQKIVDTVLFSQSSVPLSFIPSDHPLFDATVPAYKFDPVAGLKLLEQAGWRQPGGNPATPLTAVSVAHVPAGTPLKLDYYSTPAQQRREVIDILTKSLAQCGIGLNVQYYSQNDLYAPGPDGLLFGRRFDLIEYAMSTDVVQPPCDWFTGGEIPNANNHWVGTNVTGYRSTAYDAACHAAQLALPGEPAYKTSYQQAQSIFTTDLPAIPLFFRLKVAASRADVCHFDLDPSANPLWNVEAFDQGAGCK